MKIIKLQKNHWNKASKDNEVDIKYISDIEFSIKDFFNKKIKGEVLEIGCGVGRLMKSGYYGIDISSGMLDIAKKRKPDCIFKLSDGELIPYEDDKFSFVYSVLLFQHLKAGQVLTYIIEAESVLKKGGYFVFQFIEGNESEPFSNHFSLDLIKDMIDISGLKIISIKKGLIHKQWTWVTLKKI